PAAYTGGFVSDDTGAVLVDPGQPSGKSALVAVSGSVKIGSEAHVTGERALEPAALTGSASRRAVPLTLGCIEGIGDSFTTACISHCAKKTVEQIGITVVALLLRRKRRHAFLHASICRIFGGEFFCDVPCAVGCIAFPE